MNLTRRRPNIICANNLDGACGLITSGHWHTQVEGVERIVADFVSIFFFSNKVSMIDGTPSFLFGWRRGVNSQSLQ